MAKKSTAATTNTTEKSKVTLVTPGTNAPYTPKINDAVRLPIGKLVLNDLNPNVMSDDELSLLIRSIKEKGFDEPLQVVKRGEEYLIVGGHHRYRAAKFLGYTELPCCIYDWDDRKSMEEMVARNMIRGSLDHEKFGNLLAAYLKGEKEIAWQQLREAFAVEEQDLFKATRASEQMKEFIMSTKSVDELPESYTPTAEVPKAITERGDIWQLGKKGSKVFHRIMCGDSTSEADVMRLMGDDRASLIATDPPYGVDYTGVARPKSKDNKTRGKDWTGIYREIDIKDYGKFLKDVCAAASKIALPRCAWYMWYADRRRKEVDEALESIGVRVHQQIVWVKPAPVATYSYYPWMHEPCQPPGTMVLIPGTRSNQVEVPIETLKTGDTVVSYDTYSGQMTGKRNGKKIKVATRHYKGDMYRISCGGRSTKSTEEHMWTIRFSKKANEIWCVYLMKKGDLWRIGQCVAYGSVGCNLKYLAKTEGADAIWILSTHANRSDAICAEQVASVRYGIPQTIWATSKKRQLIRTKAQIEDIYEDLDLEVMYSGALAALEDHGRRIEYPLFTPDSFLGNNSKRTTSIVRSCNLIPELMELPIPKKMGEPETRRTRDGGPYPRTDRSSEEAEWLPVSAIDRMPYDGDVYSLDVEDDHHYVADGIITHNCVFGFIPNDDNVPPTNEKAVFWYMDQHEMASFGWKVGEKPPHRIDSDRHLTTVWQIDYDGKARQTSGIHPTQKPVRLFEIPMLHHTEPGAICFEPFSGSGTQIIAGERVGRSVRAMEISPVFVDAAIARWQRYTNEKAECLTRSVEIPFEPDKK